MQGGASSDHPPDRPLDDGAWRPRGTLTPLVLGASAGVELALKTPIGRRLDEQLPGGATIWVPEYFRRRLPPCAVRVEPAHLAGARAGRPHSSLDADPARGGETALG